MEDLSIGSEIVLKVVETEKEQCNGCFLMRYVTISMRMFAEILTVAQALEKTERLFNLKE
jgi:hypothetical protein